jgi:hypothetical protein
MNPDLRPKTFFPEITEQNFKHTYGQNIFHNFGRNLAIPLVVFKL